MHAKFLTLVERHGNVLDETEFTQNQLKLRDQRSQRMSMPAVNLKSEHTAMSIATDQYSIQQVQCIVETQCAKSNP
jgi:hypothetical protein